jgi:dolichyl-phosphate beta-glucosyltransferase
MTAPDTARPALSLVIPAYNEEERLPSTLMAIARYLDGRGDVEVIVVDGGSDDATYAVASSMHAELPGLSVDRFSPRMGKGYTVRRGMDLARGTIRAFLDADNSVPIEDLGRLLDVLKPRGSADIAIGSINLPESRIERPMSWLRRNAGVAANRFIRAVVVPGIHDTQRGFKALTAEASEALFSLCRVDGWGFDVELLALARAKGFSIAEIPVTWNHDPDSRVTPWSYLTALGDVIQVRWRLTTGGYDLED